MKLLKFIKVENKDEMAGSQRSRAKMGAKESGKKKVVPEQDEMARNAKYK